MQIRSRLLPGLALGAVTASIAAVGAISCDSITTGQLPDDPGPPVLMHVMIQDNVFAGGRRMATDLLEKAAGGPCTTRDPCPSGEAYQSLACHFPDPNVDTGTCPRPLRPEETPAPSSSKRLGGTQIRIVFSKLLANDTDTRSVTDAATPVTVYTLPANIKKAFGLFDGDKEVDVDDKYYDPAGSPNGTSDLFFTPYGPAVVLALKTQLVPLKKYSIHIDPSQFKDKNGQSVAPTDRLGNPVQTVYPFTVESFYIIDPENGGGNVGFNQLLRSPGGQTIKPEQAVVLFSNGPFNPTSITAAVRDANGKSVRVEAGAEVGVNPTNCDAVRSSERINVIALDTAGNPTKWAVGTYSLDVSATAQDLPDVKLKADNLGTLEFKDVKFIVKVADPDEKYDPVRDPFAVVGSDGKRLEKGQLLQPSSCPTDGGVYPLQDMASAPRDMAMPSPDQ